MIKKLRLWKLLLFICLFALLTLANSIKSSSNPFFDDESMIRRHPFQLVLGYKWVGGFVEQNRYGFPCHFLITDQESYERTVAQYVGQEKPAVNFVDHWRAKLDLVRLAINILFVWLIMKITQRVFQLRPMSAEK